MKTINLLLLALVLSVFTACDDSSDNDNTSASFITVDASSTTEWVYFSFENQDTVSVADPQESNDWDIAFKRMDFKTNSGTSGQANGGAYKSSFTDLDASISIDDSLFVVDDSIQVFVYGYQGATLTKEAGSVVLSGVKDEEAYYTTEGVWSVSGENQYRTYIANDNVFLIKCADGETAKVQFVSYYDPEDGETSGYVSFNYIK